jgi:BMFP domain-containing protein YqiC
MVMYQALMNDNTIANLASKLADSLPGGLKAVRDDVEHNFRSVLKTGIGKLDLVTREEFDVQRAVLARTREKLEALETKLAELEHTED